MEAIKLVGDARGLGTSVKVSFSVQLRRFVRVWSCLSEVAWGRGEGGRGESLPFVRCPVYETITGTR